MELRETYIFLLPITPFRLTGHAISIHLYINKIFILGEINDHYIQIAC